MNRIVINADDLGLTRSVTEGILEGLTDGVVTDASLMANGEAFDFAVEGLKARGLKTIGVHCCLVDEEEPLAQGEKIGILLDGANFPKGATPLGLFIRCLTMRFAVKPAVRVELKAQIERIEKAGLKITHLDSHQHTHLFPGIAETAIDLCVEHGIPVIRIPLTEGVGPVKWLFGYLAGRTGRLARKKGVGTVYARGYDLDGPIDQAAFDGFVTAASREPLSEIIVHPGHGDGHTHEKYAHWRTRHWDTELAALKSLDQGKADNDARKSSFEGAVEALRPIACPGCHSQAWRMTYQFAVYSIVRCSDCGLLYNRDFLWQGAVAETFSEDYYKDVQSDGFAHVFDQDRDDPSWPIYAEGLARVEGLSGVGRVLDVGCAFGSFLALARSRGWDVSGVEVSTYSSYYARTEHGFNVTTGTLIDAPLEDGGFDLVTFWDVIEHVTDVDGNIGRAAALMKPNGLLMLTTDNPVSLIGFLGALMYKLSGGCIAYPLRRFLIPQNSCYPSPGVMRDVLERHGLRVIFEAGIDHPIERINLNPLESAVLMIIYWLGNVMGANSQFIMLAQKA